MKKLYENSTLNKDSLKVLYQHCLEEAITGKWVLGKVVDTFYIGRIQFEVQTDTFKSERVFLIEMYANGIDTVYTSAIDGDHILLGGTFFHLEELISKKRFKKELKRCVEVLIKAASESLIADTETLLNDEIEEW